MPKRKTRTAEEILIIFKLLPVLFIWLIILRIGPLNLMAQEDKGAMLAIIIMATIIVSVILRNEYTNRVCLIFAPIYILNSLVFYVLKYLIKIIGPYNIHAVQFISIIELFILGFGIAYLVIMHRANKSVLKE